MDQAGAQQRRVCKCIFLFIIFIFMVGISYDHGVVRCEQCEGAITGENFAEIVTRVVPRALERSMAPRAKRILQEIHEGV